MSNNKNNKQLIQKVQNNVQAALNNLFTSNGTIPLDQANHAIHNQLDVLQHMGSINGYDIQYDMNTSSFDITLKPSYPLNYIKMDIDLGAVELSIGVLNIIAGEE